MVVGGGPGGYHAAFKAASLGLDGSRDESVASLGARFPLEFEWHEPADVPGFLDSIAWKIDEEEPWMNAYFITGRRTGWPG